MRLRGTGLKGRPCNAKNPEEYVTGVLVTLTIIGIITAIFGNTLVCVAVYKKAALRTPANYLLVSLSLASLMFVPVFVSHAISLTNSECVVKLKSLCEWSSSLNFILICVVMLHLVVISVDRLVAIKAPMRYPSLLTTRRMLAAIAVLWIVGTLEGVSPKFMTVTLVRRQQSRDVLQLLHGCLQSTRIPRNSRFESVMPHFIALLTVAIILPCVLMLVTQGWIFKIAMKQYRQIRATEKAMLARRQSEMKAAKTMAIIVLSSLACFTPLLVTTFMMAFAPAKRKKLPSQAKVKYILLPCLKILNLLAISLHPLIHALKNKLFREAFKHVLRPVKRCFCRSTTPVEFFSEGEGGGAVSNVRSSRNTEILSETNISEAEGEGVASPVENISEGVGVAVSNVRWSACNRNDEILSETNALDISEGEGEGVAIVVSNVRWSASGRNAEILSETKTLDISEGESVTVPDSPPVKIISEGEGVATGFRTSDLVQVEKQ